tara:strand:- start:183 stop:413 length:231 start_codon:yes stop_codon:yes gene_type:complete
MSLKIRSTNYKDININLENLYKISDLKNEISKQLNMKQNKQMLIFENKELIDDKLISDYNINKESLVLLYCRNKGG